MAERSRTMMWVAVGLVVTLAVGGTAAFVWIRIADSRDEPAKPPQRIDPLGELTGLEDAKRNRAQVNAKMLASAVEAYTLNPANPDSSLPNSLNDLLQPPFGGTGFLAGGRDALIDPWGQPFRMRVEVRPDGTSYVVVFTNAPDGTMISQFGIGVEEQARW